MDRRELLERSWSSMGFVWKDVNDDEAEQNSPFVVAREDDPFGESWSAGFGGYNFSEDANTFGNSSSMHNTNTDAIIPTAFHASIANFSSNKVLSSEQQECSRIHDAARVTDWPRVLRLCETHPDAARYKGRDGSTALHHACNRRCPDPDVADGLIRAYPDALLDEEEKGWTPLHYACRFKAPKDVVRLLLHLFPDKGCQAVFKRDRLGRTPLYYAVRYDAPEGVVGMLLEVDPSAVFEEDNNADSPLATVWDSWADKLEGKRALQPFLQMIQDNTSNTYCPKEVEKQKQQMLQVLKSSKKFSKKWNTTSMFLRGAFGFSVHENENTCKSTVDFEEKKDSTEEKKWRILHATVATKCHMTLFLVARGLYPEQIEELDENDLHGSSARTDIRTSHQTALHLAASSNAVGESGRNIIKHLLRAYPGAAEVVDGIEGSLPLHCIVENEHKRHWMHDGINAIYQANTNAVQSQDKKGKLPLHRAAAAIFHPATSLDMLTRSTICNLVRVYPEGASVKDNQGCLPLHVVVSNAEVWGAEVEAIYMADPSAIQVRCGKEYQNSLVIHLAASNTQAKLSLIERLVKLNPKGLSQANREGKLPLHLACECDKDWEADGVRIIHEAFPSAASIAEGNSRRWTALHIAAASAKKWIAFDRKSPRYLPQS